MDEKALSIYVFPSLTLVIHTIPENRAENRAKRNIGGQIALNIFKLSLEQFSCIRITRAKVKKNCLGYAGHRLSVDAVAG
jgi:hypothetical protein